MNSLICVVAFFVTLSSSLTLPLEEPQSSAISVYTTLTPETSPPSVYQQIATNIAGKITSPILTFLGLNKHNTTQLPHTTKKPLLNLETLDEPALKPVDNALRPHDRDVEEVTLDNRKQNNKPEKITLYSSYSNDTDDSAELDPVPENRQGGLVYFMELVASFAELALGFFMALFKPASSSGSS